ncbi:MAG: hypothetical protein JRG71_07130 [Deltaproteobacteria bacterium]|nr:hypothetical protein [Deltaproteobacteria bacterium]
MKKLTLGLCLVVLTLLSGCGYHLPGRGESLPDDIQSIVVVPFTNKTTEPFIENQLTNEVRDQFSRRRTLDVVASEEQADAVMSGVITSYRSHSVTYDENDDITEYRVTMTVDAKLVRTNGEDVIWQGVVSWHEEFFASDDRAEQDYHESEVQDDVSRRLAQELYNRLTDNF